MNSIDKHVEAIKSLPLEGFASAYLASDLVSIADSEIKDACLQIISNPVKEPKSFTLHAPLETMARSRILDYVSPESKEMARMQMCATARLYLESEPVDSSELISAPSKDYDLESMKKAVDSSDIRTVNNMLAGACKDDENILDELLARILTGSVRAAMHGDIFIGQTNRSNVHGTLKLALSQMFVRGVTLDTKNKEVPMAARRWETPNTKPNTLSPSEAISKAEAIISRIESSMYRTQMENVGSTEGIAGIIQQSWPEIPSFTQPARQIAELGEVGIEHMFRFITRVAAATMIKDVKKHRRYGWTHMLTLTEACVEVAQIPGLAKLAVEVALVIAASWRITMTEQELTKEDLTRVDEKLLPKEWDWQHILEFAAKRNDAHLVKYALACHDRAERDAESEQLFRAGAIVLVNDWLPETPEDKLQGSLFVGGDR